MSMVRIERHPSRRQLAAFGLAWLVILAAVGTALWLRGYPAAATGAWLAALLVPAAGWAVPKFMRIAYLATAYLAWPVSLAVSYLVLALAFYLVLVPIGLVMRLIGYDPMSRQWDRHCQSYWVSRKKDREPARYFRQY